MATVCHRFGENHNQIVMKKSILISGVALTVSLATFGYINWVDTDVRNGSTASCSGEEKDQPREEGLYLKVDTRFLQTITKENLYRATSILDILPAEATSSVVSYETVAVSVLDPENQIIEAGNNPVLNEAQLKLLRSADYSSDFYVAAGCWRKDAETGTLNKDTIIYYITVVPENQAVYSCGEEELLRYLDINSMGAICSVKKEPMFPGGREALLAYLKAESLGKMPTLDKNRLQPGKIVFTISKVGTVKNTMLVSTSGYSEIDEVYTQLITDMPGKWESATDANGEKVEQKFILFFGMEGC